MEKSVETSQESFIREQHRETTFNLIGYVTVAVAIIVAAVIAALVFTARYDVAVTKDEKPATLVLVNDDKNECESMIDSEKYQGDEIRCIRMYDDTSNDREQFLKVIQEPRK